MRRAHLRYLLGGAFQTLSWMEAGPADGAPVVCVHGLTRNARDFDVLAAALAGQGRRVLSVDLPGRGESGWLADPALYVPPSYAVALGHLFARLDGPIDYVGTSLGGIVGMLLAAGAHTPIRRLVLNDMGARVPAEAVRRIADYVSAPKSFPNLTAFEAHLREVHAPFGIATDAGWRHMAETSHRMAPDGSVVPHYDPAIAVPFSAAADQPINLEFVWRLVGVPTLILRGATSDVLEADVAAAMAARPGVELVTLPGIGHAPALDTPAQTDLIARFLSA